MRSSSGCSSALLLAESLLCKLRALKAELAGESPSPLERLLASRVALTWLEANYLDILVAQAAGAGEARLRALQRQQDAAAAPRVRPPGYRLALDENLVREEGGRT